MITEIVLDKVATYTEKTSIVLDKINFFYGTNGSGKSTLASVISNIDQYPQCSLKWENNNKKEIFVYNKKFVDENFSQDKNIKGIFTLGKNATEIKEAIVQLNEDIKKKTAERVKLINDNEENKSELDNLNQIIKDKCWNSKKSLDNLDGALIGYNHNKDKFMGFCLRRYSQYKKDNVKSLGELQDIYNTVYNSELIHLQRLDLINIDNIIKIETSELLSKKIEGHSETEIGRFIKYLKNSDWVRQGIKFSDNNEGRCPYCHQIITDDIKRDIEDFFDDVYDQDCKLLEQFNERYSQVTKKLISDLEVYLDNKSFKEYSQEYRDKVSLLKGVISRNISIIEKKIESPSLSVELESILELSHQINKLIEYCNGNIDKINIIVNDSNNSKINLLDQIVDYLISIDLLTPINDYLSRSKLIEDNIENNNLEISNLDKHISDMNSEKYQKEQSITSVIPTVNKINEILSAIGFLGFKIAENKSENGTYKLVRDDGNYVNNTLSEGEKNFLSFLYFSLLVRSKESTDIIVVIDDPVSSMDSNVLFIVSSLVKEMLVNCKKGPFNIIQMIILTHNIYFHKEITSDYTRKDHVNNVTYWVVKKKDKVSLIDKYQTNPIRTSYELLWSEIKENKNNPTPTILNSLRRVIEYYFKLTGNDDYKKYILDKLNDNDKLICNSLISQLHSGSHYIYDDIGVCCDKESLIKYINMFEMIFDKTGHISHYNMMMGIDNTSE